MEGVSTDKAPSASVVVPHFVVGAIGFLTLTLLILVSTESFFGHYYQAQLLAITHVAALGWVTMIIFGALYQLIPVVFETSLYSERLAKMNLLLFTLGLSGMIYAFWTGAMQDLLTWFSSLTFLALIIFSTNVLLSVRGAAKKNYSSRFIVTAIFWLFSTAILGLLLALNHKYVFLDVANFRFLKIHAHFGMIGWFLQLIMGIASVLVPMFLVSHDLDEKKLKIAYSFVNAGLLLLVMEWFLKSDGSFRPLFSGLIVVGVLFFMAYLRDAYKKKLRKLDIGMKLTTVAFTAIVLPLILGLGLSFSHYFGKGISSNLSTLYGFTIFFAFITPLILGQTYKTLPFIIWLSRYQLLVGKKKIPMPADLFSNRIAEMHLWTYVIAISTLSIGILIASKITAQIGASFLLLTALLYITNVIIIISHKTKIEPLESLQQHKSRSLMDLLKTVIDPEVEINIVDMGLIYKLDYDGDKKVDVEMTLSTPNCPIADSIVMNVMETILAKHPDFDVNVHLVFEPKWTPDLITAEGKAALGLGHKWKE